MSILIGLHFGVPFIVFFEAIIIVFIIFYPIFFVSIRQFYKHVLKKETRFWRSIGISLLLTIVMIFYDCGFSFCAEKNIDWNSGWGDYWVVPLHKPYSIMVVDSPDLDWVLEPSPGKRIVVTKVAVEDSVIIVENYFVYLLINATNRNVEYFFSYADLEKKWREIKSAPVPKMLPPVDYFLEYWSTHYPYSGFGIYFGLFAILYSFFLYILYFKNKKALKSAPATSTKKES